MMEWQPLGQPTNKIYLILSQTHWTVITIENHTEKRLNYANIYNSNIPPSQFKKRDVMLHFEKVCCPMDFLPLQSF